MAQLRKSRAKADLRWQELDQFYNGELGRNVQKLRAKFTLLTKRQAKVCALVDQGLDSLEISKLFAVEEHTIECTRSKARHILGIPPKANFREALRAILKD